jgi:hypothetical protein
MQLLLEQAQWADWNAPPPAVVGVDRLYFGHETCERLLPAPEAACDWARAAGDRGYALTLVTPFLTNTGIERARRLIGCLAAVDARFEVVCSDWGLLHVLASEKTAVPVLGRLLVARPADPRLARMFHPAAGREVTHLDGTACRLEYRAPTAEAAHHYRGSRLDDPDLIAWLATLGVRRAEVDHTPHGLELHPAPGFAYSLHTPEVLLAAMRRCPGTGEDLSARHACPPGECATNPVPWIAPGFPVPLTRRQNALYYASPGLPENLAALPIDRIVTRPSTATRSHFAP